MYRGHVHLYMDDISVREGICEWLKLYYLKIVKQVMKLKGKIPKKSEEICVSLIHLVNSWFRNCGIWCIHRDEKWQTSDDTS